jgi:hypothetical protein
VLIIDYERYTNPTSHKNYHLAKQHHMNIIREGKCVEHMNINWLCLAMVLSKPFFLERGLFSE